MKSLSMKRNNKLTVLALLVAMPTAYFILANLLNEAGIAGPYNVVSPLIEKWGGSEPLGWNINLLIGLGPVVAFLLSIFQVLKIEWSFKEQDEFLVHFSLKKKWFPLIVAAFSALCLLVMFLYLFLENYRTYHG